MKIWLRSSLLDEDCDRRLAAKQWRKVIVERDGYELRRLGNHIGAARGRANHRVFEAQLKFKRDTGLMPDRMLGVENAINMMDAEIEEFGHIIPDSTTPNKRAAAEQIKQTAREFNLGYLAYHDPVVVEEELSMWYDHHRTIMISTTPDNLTARGDLHDFKSGARRPEAPMQIGTQSMILRGHGHEPKTGALIWLPPHGEGDIISYNLKACEDEATARIEQLIRDYKEYEKERSPLAFRANKKSMTCSAAWCPAFGSDFCPLTQGEKTDG